MRAKLQETEAEKSMLEAEFLANRQSSTSSMNDSSNYSGNGKPAPPGVRADDEHKSSSAAADDSNAAVVAGAGARSGPASEPSPGLAEDPVDAASTATATASVAMSAVVPGPGVGSDPLGSSSELKEEDVSDLDPSAIKFLLERKRQGMHGSVDDSNDLALLAMSSPTELHEPPGEPHVGTAHDLELERPQSSRQQPQQQQQQSAAQKLFQEPHISVQSYYPQDYSPPPLGSLTGAGAGGEPSRGRGRNGAGPSRAAQRGGGIGGGSDFGGSGGGRGASKSGLPSYMQPTENRVRSMSPSGRQHTPGSGDYPEDSADDRGGSSGGGVYGQQPQYFFNDMHEPDAYTPQRHDGGGNGGRGLGGTGRNQQDQQQQQQQYNGDIHMHGNPPRGGQMPISAPHHVQASPYNYHHQQQRSARGTPTAQQMQMDPMMMAMYGINHDLQVPRTEQADNPLRKALRGEVHKKYPGKSSASAPLPMGAHQQQGAGGGAGGGGPGVGRARLSGMSPPRQRNPSVVVPSRYEALREQQQQQQQQQGSAGGGGGGGGGTAGGAAGGGRHGAKNFMTNTTSRQGKLAERDKPRLPTDFLGRQRNAGQFHL